MQYFKWLNQCPYRPQLRNKHRRAHPGVVSSRSTFTVDVACYETLEDRTLLSSVNPFQILEDDSAFDGETGAAVKKMIELAAGGLDSVVAYDRIVDIVTRNTEPFDTTDEAASVSFAFGAGLSITAGAKLSAVVPNIGVSTELASFKGGIGIEWNLSDNEWTVSHGITLEAISSFAVGAEEYITITATSVTAGVRFTGEAGTVIPSLSFGSIVGPSVTFDFNDGEFQTYSIYETFSHEEFLDATRRSTFESALISCFTPVVSD